MGVLYSQASFKNSRVASRKATTTAGTDEKTVLAAANTLIAPTNLNRTYLTLRNLDTTPNHDLRYDYFDNPLILTKGFLLKAGEAIDLESPQTVYGRATLADVLIDTDEGQG